MFRYIIALVVLLCGIPAALAAQNSGNSNPQQTPQAEGISLAGPRFGLTYLPRAVREKASEHAWIDFDLRPVITQFGWQFEKRFFTVPNGPTAVTEIVLLAGGLDQSVFIPSLSWLIGIRSSRGTEFGVGPNVSPAGIGLAIAGGVTYTTGPVHFPVNFALVPGRHGLRLSSLVGFNMGR